MHDCLCVDVLVDAQSERQTSVYSPPFYSSSSGYKMRARLYLNGDGNARQTHMSLFFVLMRGRHDAILKFPFDHKVIFCLYDQTSVQRHIVDSFRPDVKSSNYQWPQSEMNLASGIEKFCELCLINSDGRAHVQSDTMFIRIKVDFENIPKPALPFFINLDPGLPTRVQQQMVIKDQEQKQRGENGSSCTTKNS